MLTTRNVMVRTHQVVLVNSPGNTWKPRLRAVAIPPTDNISNSNQENKNMAFKMIDKATVPQTARGFGKVAGPPKVSIAGSGQIRFSTNAGAAFPTDHKLCLILRDDKENRKLLIKSYGKELPKNVTAEKCWELKRSVSKSGKLGQAYISGGGILKLIGYDYGKAGDQSFDCQVDVAKNTVVFDLPATEPAKREVTPRKKRSTAAGAGATATNKPAEDLPDINIE